MEPLVLDISRAIDAILSGDDLTFRQSYEVMSHLMSEDNNPVLTASLLTALRNSREKAEEIAGFSAAMLDHAEFIEYTRDEPLIDIVGTGGAQFKTFNVSTTASLVLPSIGVSVAKHGNRSNSSPSGSADLLEALGVNITMNPERAMEALNKNGLTFMFAPLYHPAMKHIVPVRKTLRFRTIFNLLGPLTNPARVKRQLTGLFSLEYLLPVAQALQQRGHERAILVHSDLGADEVTNVGTTHVAELNEGHITEYTLTAKSFGLTPCNPMEISSISPEESAREVVRILSGSKSPRADFTKVNASLALRASGREESLPELVTVVEEVLESGSAIDNIRNLIRVSGGDEDSLEDIINVVG